MADELERIRNKPMVELTSEEIDLLTTQEQRWVLSYRASQIRQANKLFQEAANG